MPEKKAEAALDQFPGTASASAFALQCVRADRPHVLAIPGYPFLALADKFTHCATRPSDRSERRDALENTLPPLPRTSTRARPPLTSRDRAPELHTAGSQATGSVLMLPRGPKRAPPRAEHQPAVRSAGAHPRAAPPSPCEPRSPVFAVQRTARAPRTARLTPAARRKRRTRPV